jgi:ABC-2 type transport system permease protein
MTALGKVLAIARIGLLQQVRDRTDLVPVFVLPAILIVMIGLQFADTSRARLGVVTPAGDAAAASLVSALTRDTNLFDVRQVADEATLRSELEGGALDAGLEIPPGFDAALQGGGTPEVRYLGATNALTLGLRTPIQAAVSHLDAVVTASRVAVSQGVVDDWTRAETVAAADYGVVPGVAINVTQTGKPGIFSGFGQFTAGASTQLVLFTFLTSLTAAGRLVYSRQVGVSRRMLSTPTSAWTIVAGETLGRFGIALFQAFFIVLLSSLVFGVSWGSDLPATAALLALFCAVAAAAAMLLGAVARNATHAAVRGGLVALALAALGGCLIPVQAMPSDMQLIAKLVPHSWAVLGLQDLVRGGGLTAVLPNLAVLAGFATVLLALATWRFREAITR